MALKQFKSKVLETPVPRLPRLLSLLLAFLFMASTFLLFRVPDSVKGYIYGLFREIARGQMLLRTAGWQQIEDDLMIIRYRGDEEGANLVRETTRLFYERICDDFNYLPERKIPIVVYDSREALNASFGWPASENAMGVYWGGVIRVLAPQVWINENDPDAVRQIFRQAGPMAHEMTHLVLDYLARGNYPRWFTEGLAQYEEYKITGFMFGRQAGIWDRGLYPLNVMDRNFDALPDQALAYRQSLSAVEYIVAVYGEDGLHNIIKNLSRGVSFHDSLERALGVTPGRFEKAWHAWLAEGLQQPLFVKREDEIYQWTN
ncbi:peptidase MA family metallohydrolase [Desulfoscipio geothermicus]|uniref:Peptidase MA superfamily protein n=1 Tax=Desulfoscipio geothermicus DSM 3669 TaxID=1121426 RepID=A0A1I6CZG5_9FIRM|nr:peptidase MA family metallohydrolase [Desulfoscipio geothermicus]SFQ98492.1 Peptidase MA superfamily protein [Desulfoscipio geothermicus DSM 3669]